MKLIRPSYEILTPLDRQTVLKAIEVAGRTCYKSESRTTEDSASAFVSMVCKRNHESVLEHVSMSVRFICDRGVSHELVRHRLTSVSQESTRYVNYEKRQMEFIIPPWCEVAPDSSTAVNFATEVWVQAMESAEAQYCGLLANGWKPEQARSVLPNALKTEVVMTANMREWKHIFHMRTSSAAHPQMRELMFPLQEEMRNLLPEIFE